MKKRVFISRSLPENHLFRNELSNVEWIDQPLISIEPIPFDIEKCQECAWLFFTSSNAAKIYFKSAHSSLNQRIAAISSGTANTLSELGENVAFVGNQDTRVTAMEFAKVLGDESACFPASNLSLRTIQQYLSPAQVVDMVIYNTIESPVPIPPCDLYFFTSPSNVRAFFELNAIPKGSKVVSLGKATGGELEKYGIESTYPDDFQLDAQLQAIFSAISS